MRVSDYLISISIPDTQKTLLLHGYTGAVDLVDNKLAKFLNDCKDGEGLLCFDSNVVETLTKRGYLTEKTSEQETETAGRIGEMIYQKIRERVVNFVLIPTYDCNLRCSYCYQRQLRKKGDCWIAKKMDISIVDAVFRAMEAIEPEKVRYKKITLYGGEPLLASNYEVVAYILEKGTEKGYRFAVVTNGVEIDNYLSMFKSKAIESVQITLDGPPEVHDRRRVMINGRGTFEKIAENISTLLDMGIKVQIRVNTDKDNIQSIVALVDIFKEKGWSKKSNFLPYMSPTHSLPAKKKEKEINLLDLKEKLFKQNNQSRPPISLNDYRIGARFNEVLKEKGLFPFKPYFCGSNMSMYVFDPHGDIYSCWETVGIPREKVGCFLPELLFDRYKLLRWQEHLVFRISGCNTCKYAFFCGGGCSYLAFAGKEGHLSQYCREFPHMFQRDVLDVFCKDRLSQNF